MRDYLKDLEQFNITREDLPEYTNPEKYAKEFKRCSVYTYGNISYSSSSSPVTKPENAKTHA